MTSLQEASQELVNFAWSMLRAPNEESRVYLNSLVDNVRKALKGSAPSETVGRGEDIKFVASLFAELDGAETPFVDEPKDYQEHCRKRARKLVSRLALPTADRDAIREKMNVVKSFLDGFYQDVPGVAEATAAVTAALALIGEG